MLGSGERLAPQRAGCIPMTRGSPRALAASRDASGEAGPHQGRATWRRDTRGAGSSTRTVSLQPSRTVRLQPCRGSGSDLHLPGSAQPLTRRFPVPWVSGAGQVLPWCRGTTAVQIPAGFGARRVGFYRGDGRVVVLQGGTGREEQCGAGSAPAVALDAASPLLVYSFSFGFKGVSGKMKIKVGVGF